MATVHDSLFAGGLALLKGTHGRAATWTRQSTGGTTAVTVLLTVNPDGLSGTARIAQSDLAAAPTRGDSFVLTGSSARWYVEVAQDRESPDSDYTLDVNSNAAE